jgi:hypothetical protein
MTGKFDIEINMNGWLVPMHIEQKGEGVFKVAYEDITLGYLLQNERSRWQYVDNIFNGSLLNAQTTAMIGKAIINY